MTTVYVYAPITSVAYLPHEGGGGHCDPSGSQGLDCLKAGSQGMAVRFYASSNVKSVRFTQVNNCAPGCTQNYKNAVKAELYGEYNASGCYFGWVLYGHLQSPISNQVWNGNWSKTVGYVVDYVSGDCSYYNDNDHVHMEANLGIKLITNWYASLTQGTTAVYKFLAAC